MITPTETAAPSPRTLPKIFADFFRDVATWLDRLPGAEQSRGCQREPDQRETAHEPEELHPPADVSTVEAPAAPTTPNITARQARAARLLTKRPHAERLYWPHKPGGLNLEQRCILERLDEVGIGMNVAEICRLTGLSRKLVLASLVTLEQRKIVEYLPHPGRGGYRLLPAVAVDPKQFD